MLCKIQLNSLLAVLSILAFLKVHLFLTAGAGARQGGCTEQLYVNIFVSNLRSRLVRLCNPVLVCRTRKGLEGDPLLQGNGIAC